VRVTLSNKHSSRTCIVHYDRHISDCAIRRISETAFNTIRTTVSVRGQQSIRSPHRLEEICHRVPALFDAEMHGAHRWCYKNFTNISHLRGGQSNKEPLAKHRVHHSVSARTSTVSPRVCLFCGTVRKFVKGKTKILRQCQMKDTEATIRHAATEKEDFKLLGRISDCDLIAKEAVYHEYCRRTYITRADRSHHMAPVLSTDDIQSTVQQRAAYNDAFLHVCEYITEEVIRNGRVIRLSMALEKYLQFIQQHKPECYNPNHQTHKLKTKLLRHFGQQIQFWSPNSIGDLIYSSDLSTGAAVQAAFEAATSESKQLEEAALILQRYILDAHKNASEMPWPPSSDCLLSSSTALPPAVTDFLAVLITGKTTMCQRNTRVVASVAEDICTATTRGQWKLPKHLLLGMTVRHLTGSAQLITLLNRFGHCTAYSQLLELETAMAVQVLFYHTTYQQWRTNSRVVVGIILTCWKRRHQGSEQHTVLMEY